MEASDHSGRYIQARCRSKYIREILERLLQGLTPHTALGSSVLHPALLFPAPIPPPPSTWQRIRTILCQNLSSQLTPEFTDLFYPHSVLSAPPPKIAPDQVPKVLLLTSRS